MAGSLGEALFFATLFLLGAVALAALITAQFTGGPQLAGWSFGLVLAVLASFALIGGGGFVLTMLQLGASAERRSALMRRSGDLVGDGAPESSEFPAVPRETDLTDSPGTVLEYRLPVITSPLWQVTAAAVFCLLWNVATAVVAVLAVESHVNGRSDWLLTALGGVMLVAGVWSVLYFFRRLADRTGVGSTSVEISDLPLQPGRRYEVVVAQTGQAMFDALDLHLVCEEEATFSQGTDIRTEVRRVHSQQVLAAGELQVGPGQPFERRCNLVVPETAMHSFKSAHNAVHWKLVVRGKPRHRPAFERTFPLIVHPRSPEANGR